MSFGGTILTVPAMPSPETMLGQSRFVSMTSTVPAGALTVDVPLSNVAVHGSHPGAVFEIANPLLSPTAVAVPASACSV